VLRVRQATAGRPRRMRHDEGVEDWFDTPVTPLAGGYSGETFVAGAGNDRVVVRIYRRRPERAPIDASLLRLVRGIVPVPEVVELRAATADRPAVLVTEFLDGVSLDALLRADPPTLDWETLGHNLGWVLGSLSGIPFLHFGEFTDARLAIAPPGLPTELSDWARRFRDTGRLAAWAEADWRLLLSLIDLAEDMLTDGQDSARVVLAHSDFNPKNILVDPTDLRFVGLLDWEFAHAGSINTDFGNFTRFERDDRIVGPLIEGFVKWAPGHITEPFGNGRAVDLWALVELAGRTPVNPVGELATALLLAQAREQSLDAWPWPTSRVDPVDADAVP
jgi:aminoglycoside phosphotransferase (APT) family kinase protein